MDIKRVPKTANPSLHSPASAKREYFYNPPKLNEVFHPVKKKKPLWLKFSLSLFLAILFLVIAYGFFMFYKAYSVSKKISLSGESASFLETVRSFTDDTSFSDLKGGEEGRVNILLLGIAGQGKAGQNLTDTIIILSLDTKTNRVALLSVPRDLYVEIPRANLQMKINSAYQFGINTYEKEVDEIKPLLDATKEITSLDMHYYAILNFDGFQKIIDSLGGINVINERDIYDARYPGPNYSYETFELQKGFHHLDGATALKYARVRHGDPEGDFGRAKRQQQVMQTTKNKIFSAATLFNAFALNDLLNALGDNIKTNIQPQEIKTFLKLAGKLDTQNVNNMVLDAWNKDSLLKVSHIDFGNIRGFVLLPRVGTYTEIQELAKNIFDLNELKKKEAEIAKEDARVMLINQSGDRLLAEKIKKMLSDNLNYKNISVENITDEFIEEKTFIYDLTGGTKLFTLDELVKKLPASLAENLPEYLKNSAEFQDNPPLIVVLGKDLAKIYNREEGTVEDLNNDRDNQELIDFK